MRSKKSLTLVALVILIIGVTLLVHGWANRGSDILPADRADAAAGSFRSSAFTYAALTPQFASPAGPRVNPYAVVRHGICVPSNAPDQEAASRKKWEALLRDPFWQSIFSGVNPDKFFLVKTSHNLHRYVTYWKMKHGRLIHWTGRKILIPSGTRVFTDVQGDMYLCACGNQVATVLPPKASAAVLPAVEEPPIAYLVPREEDPFPVIARELPGETLVPNEDLIATMPYSKLPGIVPAPEMPPIFLGAPPPPGSGPIPPPPVQPPVVPEPDTFSLTLIGLGASTLASCWRKRR